MNENKLILKIIVFGFLVFQYSFAKSQDTTKYLAKNNIKDQNNMSTLNKFEFKLLPYGYEALEPFY